jgi:hypothetical protein
MSGTARHAPQGDDGRMVDPSSALDARRPTAMRSAQVSQTCFGRLIRFVKCAVVPASQ